MTHVVSKRGRSARPAVLIAALGSLTLSLAMVRPNPAPAVAPASPTSPQPIRVASIARKVTATAAPGHSTAIPSDPHSLSVAEGIRTRLLAHRPVPAPSGIDPKEATAARAKQSDGLNALRARTGFVPRLIPRPGVGTPAQLDGGILEPAAGERADRADRNVRPVRDDGATVRRFLRNARDALRIDDPDAELRITRHRGDELGRRHIRLSQQYGGLPVWPCELTVHLDPQGNVNAVNGAFVPTPGGLSLTPRIDAAAAIQIARLAVAAGKSARASDPELIIHAPGDRAAALAWKLQLTRSTVERWTVLVDAAQGHVRVAFNDVPSDGPVSGMGVGLFSVPTPVHGWDEQGTFFLIDVSKMMFNPASNPPDPDSTTGAIFVLDAVNRSPDANGNIALDFVTSVDVNSWMPPDAVSAAFSLSETYDYYLERHNRNSLDGSGSSIIAIVRFGQNFVNAFWNGTFLVFGDGAPFAGALDVVAHELTHAVIENTANLVYLNQPGAMNEAFADIFGEFVEARSRQFNDWTIGTGLDAPIRSLSDPASLDAFPGIPYPAKLSDFIVTNADNGGVHLNSTIIGHAAFLAASGTPGAIGIPDAEKIFYRALTVHLVANSQFYDLRLACILSAEELFGVGSAQAARIAEAFDTVEITSGTPTPPNTGFDPVNAPDSTMFLISGNGPLTLQTTLSRREDALADPVNGSPVGMVPSSISRATVTGDGSLGAYVTAGKDLCIFATDGTEEDCLGLPETVHSVAISPDGLRFAFVLLGSNGQPLNEITVLDLNSDDPPLTFLLESPATVEGGALNSVLYADAMDFTSDGNLLLFDALNYQQLPDESSVALWSIYALDIRTGLILVVVPPTQGFDIGFPNLSQTSDDFLTFDAFDQAAAQSTVMAANLQTGQTHAVVTVAGSFAAPTYTGDDDAIVYMTPDENVSSSFALKRQPLNLDRLTPMGAPTAWLDNGLMPVIYRRGAYVGGPHDTDGDSFRDETDNCPSDFNPDQYDLDGDGKGTICDSDDDGDGIADIVDNCPEAANPDQIDADTDGTGDACDDQMAAPDHNVDDNESGGGGFFGVVIPCGTCGAGGAGATLISLAAITSMRRERRAGRGRSHPPSRGRRCRSPRASNRR